MGLFRGEYAYISGQLPDGDKIPLMRLHYGGSAASWGFAIYLASKDGYEPAVLPTGVFAGALKTPSTPPAAPTSTTPEELSSGTTKRDRREHDLHSFGVLSVVSLQ